MKISLFFSLFFFSVLCHSQENFDPYREAFDDYIHDYIESQKLTSNETIYLIKKEITNNFEEKIYVNKQEYNIEQLSTEQIKKKKIDYIFEVMPIRNFNGKLSVDIILLGIEIRRKKVFFIHSGGERYSIKFDCNNQKYSVIREYINKD